MAPIGKLYGSPLQAQIVAILSAAAIAGLEIESPPFEFGVTNKEPDFVHKFPQRKVPAFEGTDGFKLFEGAIIARYVSSLVPESGLLGRGIKETTIVDQWVHFAESELILPTGIFFGALVAKVVPGYNVELHEFWLQRVTCSLKFLEDYLATCPSGFIVNDSITLADIFIAAATKRSGMTWCGAAERGAYPHVFAHYVKVASDGRVKAFFGQPEFVDKPLAFQAE
ncbi:hypothetical protein SCLCIDRAFT_1221908 [Scleroderma citrinum Foug A]|uniref:GST C-terminal domain-containing protein n=1 Tax=Scleroderma citrinum Foug A TaxID=1036808 RepID=A0A0C2ZPJ5_9AGAM|nr:hypothetical protein SCLCIDRAFT_1221908 [Scleroderma citrinum Foug A]